MFNNFQTLGDLIREYASQGLLDEKAACEAIPRPLDRPASLEDRFAALCLCAIGRDGSEVLRVAGMYTCRGMTEEQERAWEALRQHAVKAAKETPEGVLLHGSMPDDPSECLAVHKALDGYHFYFARRAWQRQFTEEGGYLYLDRICDEAVAKAGPMPVSRLMAIYKKAAEDLPWQPDIPDADFEISVKWALSEMKRHGF